MVLKPENWGDNLISTMGTGALAPCVTGPLTTMVLTVLDKQVLVFSGKDLNISILQSYWKCKYISVFAKINLANNYGLITTFW